ncbi:zinc ribbon domain-containing protein [Mycobacterium servetii]|uniref:Zinc ribbon domain-containing protein n=1 Tax=Mycobacterium servetii TaxID=3237418 RepID=A0ABV4BU09_9MYCO
MLVVGYVTNKDLRTLYPIGPDGNPITTQPGTLADFGIAIYVAGAGVAAASVGSLMLLRIATQALEAADDELVDSWTSQNVEAKTKKCPDCAETVLADARVCKHCGYRFAPAPVASSEPITKSPVPTQPRPRPASNDVPESLGKAPIPIGSSSASDLQVGRRVRVVLSGDDFDGKVGMVKGILDNGDVHVKFGPLSGTYCFGHDELKPI